MRCVRERHLRVEEFGDIAALPAAARALFGAEAFSSLAWYGSTLRAGLAADERASFHVVSAGGSAQAVLPMRRGEHGLSALSTPYTCLWQPLLETGLDAASQRAIGRALADHWRGSTTIRFDALDADAAYWPALHDGFRRGGLHCLPFDHFGNWHLDVAGQGWADYLATRPGALREAIRRRGKRLMEGMQAGFTLTSSPEGLSDAIAAYETIYEASWKQPEPFTHFNATLMRACAMEGTLRLGVLRIGPVPVAAQFWWVFGTTAFILKLAHDEAHKALAPGTVLTSLMIRHLLDHDHVAQLDFGRGDDPYKRLWTGARRQRVGLLLANPLSLSGLRQVVTHRMSGLKRALRKVGQGGSGAG